MGGAQNTKSSLALAPDSGPIHDYLTAMANRHRAEVEWGRAEVIKFDETRAELSYPGPLRDEQLASPTGRW